MQRPVQAPIHDPIPPPRQRLNLLTPRLRIRHMGADDLDDFHAYRSLAHVVRHQGFDVMTHGECAAFIHSQKDKQFGRPGEWVQYALANALADAHTDARTDALLGDCAIHLVQDNPAFAQLGITLNPAHWGQGLATEALREIMRFLFEEAGVQSIACTVDADNAPSLALFKRLGYREAGRMAGVPFKGHLCTEVQFVMDSVDWQEISHAKQYE